MTIALISSHQKLITPSPLRNGRPNGHKDILHAIQPVPERKCDFCKGEPPRVGRDFAERIVDGKKGWLVRGVSNLHPIGDGTNGMAEGIIVMPREHDAGFENLPAPRKVQMLLMLQEGIRYCLEEHPRKIGIADTAVFDNYKFLAGGTVNSHFHFQIVPLTELMDEARAAADLLKMENCVFCKPNGDAKVVFENQHFRAFCIRGSRYEYEIHIAGQHVPSLTNLDDSQLASLADAYSRAVTAIGSLTPMPDHNAAFMIAPVGCTDYHFNLAIIPRHNRDGGLELLKGIKVARPFEQWAPDVEQLMNERRD
jgi:galactose-1-phosphate uridylyltransferase